MFKRESRELNVQLAPLFDEDGRSCSVIRLETSQIELLAHVLSRAFHDEPRFTYMMPDEKTRRTVLPWLFSSAIRASQLWGEIYTMPSMEGGALWIRPGRTFSFRRIVRVGLQLPFKLPRAHLRRCIRLNACLEQIHQGLAASPHWYLMALGVEPSKEGEAIAGALIVPALSRADSEGVPCYVETFREKDLPFYEEHGFRIEGSGLISGCGPGFWVMKRAPRPCETYPRASV